MSTNALANTPRDWSTVVQDDPSDPKFVRMSKADLDAWRAAQNERARGMTITQVPSTPRFVQRETGGAVRRGAHRKQFSIESLRHMRENSILFAPIHNARQHQIRRLATPWDGDKTKVGVKVVHKDWNANNAEPPDGFETYIAAFERVLWRPSEQYGYLTLGDALAELEEDRLTINRPAIEIMPSIVDPSRILEWKPVDGGLMWPTLTFVEHWWNQSQTMFGWDRGQIRAEDAVELLSRKLDVDLAGMDYALVRDGQAVAWYPKDRVIVGPWKNRTDVSFAGYPPSPLEEALPYAFAFADAFEFTSGHLSRGIFLDYILGLPSALHDDDVDAFLNMLQEIGQGVKGKGRIAAIPLPPGFENGLPRIPLQAEFNEMGFQSMISLCASLVATGIYRMHASTIGMRPWNGSQGNSLNQGSMTEEIGLAQEEGLRSDMGHLTDRFLNELARRCHPDLRVYTHFGDFDPQKAAAIIQTKVNSIATVNEGRLEDDLPPLGFWMPPEKLDNASDEDLAEFSDNPYNHPLPICQTLIAAKVQQQAQQQMMQGQMQQQQAQAASGGDFTQFNEPEPPPEQPMGKAVRTVTLHIHGGDY